MTETIGGAKGSPWPPWARWVVSGLLLVHLVGVVAVGLASPPSSPMERVLADRLLASTELIDQGHAHRYYVDPPPTPILLARLRYGNGREETIRLPDRKARPRLFYQRQLALAYHLFGDYRQARASGRPGEESPWARSYARHLCGAHPGCEGVTLLVQLHLVPDLERLKAAAEAGAPALDVDSEEFYTTPERIGDFPCDDF